MGKKSALCCALLLFLVLGAAPASAALSRGRVFINGKPCAVFFNDGDSFRVLSGHYRGAKARLAGFNTLESHGPVHQWGGWTAKELYVIAKMATLHARRGTWHCTTDEKRDGYGRMLMWCRDLAISQVAHGYAHAMSITDNPARPELLKAQAAAIKGRRGIWAHGAPPYVLTSIHSVEEDTTNRGTYNRLVSSGDGHSAKWWHTDKYTECQNVCLRVRETNDVEVNQAVAALQKDPEIQGKLVGATREQLVGAVRHFAQYNVVDKPFPYKLRRRLMYALQRLQKKGMLGGGKSSTCMIHVAFKRRYGRGKAACLK